MLVVATTSLSGYVAFVSWFMNSQQEQAISHANSVGMVLGQEFARLLLMNDINAATDISSKLQSFDQVDAMVLYNQQGVAIHRYRLLDNETIPALASLPNQLASGSSGTHYLIDNNRIDIYVPAIYQQTELGYVLIRLKIHSVIDILWKDLPIILLIAFFMLFLSFLLANLLEKQFTDPILKLVRFLEEIIDDGKLDKRVATNENNEFKILYREVNTMLESLEVSQQQLKLASVSFDTPSGMLISDANHTIVQANKAFYTVTGYTPEETIGNTTKMLQSG
jgi:methyl-accepting chemotaxis protein